MTGQAFRFTRKFLNGAPVVYLSLSSVILFYYVMTEAYQGLRYVVPALACMTMAYWGNRVRYNLIERRRRDLRGARVFIGVHRLTGVLIPFVMKAQQEMENTQERQNFFADTFTDAYTDMGDPRAARRANLRILVWVAYFGLVMVSGIYVANEYITFETIKANTD